MLITITGPACAGKSTFEKELVSNKGWNRITSFTTREPRQGEVDGVDYFFLEEPPPESDVVEQVEYNGKFYGILKSELEKARTKNTVVVVEPNGATKLESYCAENDILVFKIFITQPSAVLVKRFLSRSVPDLAKNPSLIEYYSERLVSLLQEHETWYNPLLYDALLVGQGEDLMEQLKIYEELT